MGDGEKMAECMLCFEVISSTTELRGCDLCGKQWCSICDNRWRLARMNAALFPTCPFCRKRLYTGLLEEQVLEEQLERPIISLFQCFLYIAFAIIILLLPVFEAYLAETDELFICYFCLTLFVFLFLCCYYIHKGIEEVEDEETI